jgi:hypothetical protein
MQLLLPLLLSMLLQQTLRFQVPPTHLPSCCRCHHLLRQPSCTLPGLPAACADVPLLAAHSSWLPWQQLRQLLLMQLCCDPERPSGRCCPAAAAAAAAAVWTGAQQACSKDANHPCFRPSKSTEQRM